MKGQGVRLVDVFFIGPYMLYAAAKREQLSDMDRLVLSVTGALTILYNGQNYMRQRAASSDLQST